MKCLLLSLLIFIGLAEQALPQSVCPNGAPAPDIYCKHIWHFERDENSTIGRLADLFGNSTSSQVRSFALIGGISKYKNLGQLPPAAADISRLKRFLTNHQRFDEVVVLQDEDFNISNISYFINVYFYDRVKKFPKSRFLFAYSGHGISSDDTEGPSFILLSNANDWNDRINALNLRHLRSSLQDIARRSYQTLVLLNACFGGSMLDFSFSNDIPRQVDRPGAHAITAGRARELVYSLSEIGPGSIFFETLISGVETGRADAFPFIGDKRGDGVVTFEEFLADLKQSISELKNGKLQSPLAGSIEPRARMGGGAFFFLSKIPNETNSNTRMPDAKAQTFGPAAVDSEPRTSVLPENIPEKIIQGSFIKGVSISKWNGSVNWMDLKKGGIRFAYLKATEGDKYLDENFNKNWKETQRLGIPRGAYHFMFWCVPVSEQIEWLKKNVPVDSLALPPVLDIEWNGSAPSCPSRIDKGKAQSSIKTMLEEMERHFGKRPVIYTDYTFHRDVLEGSFYDYIFWLRSVSDVPEKKYGGRRWALWQYTDTGRVPGTRGDFILNSFNGSEANFARFISGNLTSGDMSAKVLAADPK